MVPISSLLHVVLVVTAVEAGAPGAKVVPHVGWSTHAPIRTPVLGPAGSTHVSGSWAAVHAHRARTHGTLVAVVVTVGTCHVWSTHVWPTHIWPTHVWPVVHAHRWPAVHAHGWWAIEVASLVVVSILALRGHARGHARRGARRRRGSGRGPWWWWGLPALFRRGRWGRGRCARQPCKG